MSLLTVSGFQLLTEISQLISQEFRLSITWPQPHFLRLLSFMHSSIELIYSSCSVVLRHGCQDSRSCSCSSQCPNPIQCGSLKFHLLHKALNFTAKVIFSYCDPITTLYLDHFKNVSQKSLNSPESLLTYL